MSDMLLDEGVFVTGFGFPVVPQGQARVRCQLSAAHSRDDLDQAIAAFKTVGSEVRHNLEEAFMQKLRSVVVGLVAAMVVSAAAQAQASSGF